MDKRAATLMKDIMFPRRTFTCLAGIRAMREDSLVICSFKVHILHWQLVSRFCANAHQSLQIDDSHACKQDFLHAASQAEGPLKEGQRYWARFALCRIQSWLSAEKMQEILAAETDDNFLHLERGALLLVRNFLFAFSLPVSTT